MHDRAESSEWNSTLLTVILSDLWSDLGTFSLSPFSFSPSRKEVPLLFFWPTFFFFFKYKALSPFRSSFADKGKREQNRIHLAAISSSHSSIRFYSDLSIWSDGGTWIEKRQIVLWVSFFLCFIYIFLLSSHLKRSSFIHRPTNNEQKAGLFLSISILFSSFLTF